MGPLKKITESESGHENNNNSGPIIVWCSTNYAALCGHCVLVLSWQRGEVSVQVL